MRLVADIGGTKALVGLVDETSGEGLRFLVKERLICGDYENFSQLLGAFLTSNALDVRKLSGGCLAVAGPISDDGGSVRLTNLPWIIDVEALSREFGIGRVVLVNDFAAAALGVTAVDAKSRVVLQAGEPVDEGVRLVVGAGTGLGMAILIREGLAWRVLPGEGGHAGFAPANESQAALRAYLARIHGRVEYEHVVSGPGLVNIYRFVAGSAANQGLLAASDPAGAIAAQAMQEPDGVARLTLDLFLAAYGAFAGDMALATLARGGVFLAGGIATKILPLMQSGTFAQAFTAKAKHSGLVARMPVYVVTDAELGLHGAALYDRCV